MPLSLDAALGLHPQALKVRARRAEIISNNIANQDTPGFKARDLNFKEILQEADRIRKGQSLERTNAKHLQIGQGLRDFDLKYRIPNQPSVDGNTVDSQLEVNAFMENNMRYQASLQFLDGNIKGLRKAIRGE